MSQNAAEGNAAFVIWSNECLDWDNWSEAFEEDYSNLTEEEKYRLMEELNGDYLDDERRNLDIRVGTPILILADIGRWDGRHTGYREIESGCIKDCLYSQLDGVAWYVDTQGDLRMDGYHHDGHQLLPLPQVPAGRQRGGQGELQRKDSRPHPDQTDIDRVTERAGRRHCQGLRLFTAESGKRVPEKEGCTMKKEIVFVDEDTLTPEEWEGITDEQTEE